MPETKKITSITTIPGSTETVIKIEEVPSTSPLSEWSRVRHWRHCDFWYSDRRGWNPPSECCISLKNFSKTLGISAGSGLCIAFTIFVIAAMTESMASEDGFRNTLRYITIFGIIGAATPWLLRPGANVIVKIQNHLADKINENIVEPRNEQIKKVRTEQEGQQKTVDEFSSLVQHSNL